MDVRLIAAVGRDGQLGLRGKLPWHDALDLRWFRENTIGGIVLMGARTFDAVGPLPGRARARWTGKTEPYTVLRQISARYPGKTIWVAGGSWTYLSFMPFVRIAVITRIDYDGLADAYMPPLWGQLYAHGDASSHHRPTTPATGADPLPKETSASSDSSDASTSPDSSLRRKRHRRRAASAG